MKILELSPEKEEVLGWLNDVCTQQKLDALKAEDGTICLDAAVLDDAKIKDGAWKRWNGFLSSLPIKEKSGKLVLKNQPSQEFLNSIMPKI